MQSVLSSGLEQPDQQDQEEGVWDNVSHLTCSLYVPQSKLCCFVLFRTDAQSLKLFTLPMFYVAIYVWM